jgi:hypothetical protein
MATADIDLTLYFRKKRTPPPSVLLLALASDKVYKDRQHHVSPTVELRSRQQKKRQTTSHNTVSNANNSDNHESSSLYGWQRHSDKIGHITAAPDVVYRNTYMEESKREKSATTIGDYRSHISTSRSPSPRSQQSLHQPQQIPRLKTASSASHHTSDSSQHKSYYQYRTVYDYIRESIKQIERQRNLKQPNFSSRVKRPQNDDSVLRRALAEKKTAATSKYSSISRNDLRNPQSLVNYINHSREQIRVLHTTTPNQSYPSQQHQQTSQKYLRQRTSISGNQNDSLEKQQSLMMTATTGNS